MSTKQRSRVPPDSIDIACIISAVSDYDISLYLMLQLTSHWVAVRFVSIISTKRRSSSILPPKVSVHVLHKPVAHSFMSSDRTTLFKLTAEFASHLKMKVSRAEVNKRRSFWPPSKPSQQTKRKSCTHQSQCHVVQSGW